VSDSWDHLAAISMWLNPLAIAVDYCASKAALITMHDALRFELNNRYKAPQIRTTLLLPGHIRTPLFDKIQFPRSLFFRFMAPSLEPGQVVQKIVRALAAQESRVVRMPFYTHSARLLNLGSGLTPGWIRDFLQWVSTRTNGQANMKTQPDLSTENIDEPG
jgi:all-trans-retinol dehydrogenase (NAD+)